ncbi:SWIM zinc finger family protein [Halomicrococcus sp. NG-SE-24]|uniref:SWIM zinc finger family protein n=1 Tax=Halomicrococcus sp. NG-SE-24 TaxID=3436928 RepID=UPI003D977E0C
MPNTAASRKASLVPLRETGEEDARSQRARAERMAVAPLGGGLYEVESQSNETYFVDLPGGRCTCPDHMFRGVRCKHVRRVAIEINEGRVPPPGEKAAECTSCGTTVFVDENADGVHLCEHCDLPTGTPVVDRESGDLLVVVEVTDRRADEVDVPDRDCTVAEYPNNVDYPDDDPVVELLYPLPNDLGPGEIQPRHLRRYSFPLSRLERREQRDDEQTALTDFPATTQEE